MRRLLMAGKRRLQIPNEQLAFTNIEPILPKKQEKPSVPERTETLERRVTQLEAEVALIMGQLEQSEDDD
jgi:hypothetical protein